MSDDNALLARMEADHANALKEIDDLQQWLTERRQQASELEIAIRTVRSYVASQAVTRAVGAPSIRIAEPAPLVALLTNGNGKSPWEGQSIRTAAIQILGRTPGKVVSAQDIAITLIAENYPFKDAEKRPVKVQRVRETVSAVLNQHIAQGLNPTIEKPEAARFILPQQDAFAGDETELPFAPETEQAEKGDPA